MIEPIDIFYTVLAIIFLCVMTWMFLYTRGITARIRKLEASGHKIHSLEEGIYLAGLEKEREKHARATHA
jgi:hypothetical protein